MVQVEDELLLGSQVPTHSLLAPYEYSRGDEAIEVAELAGLTLDPYQREVLTEGLGVVHQPSSLIGDDNAEVEKWAAYEVGIELSRQNGKSVIFEARALAGLYVFREKLIVYSAHKGETAMDAFNRIEQLIRNDPELLAEVAPNGWRRTNGKEAIVLLTGQTIKFRTRTAGGGRGLSGDCVILDEAQELTDDHLAALFPVLSARPNPQLWYGGSAGTKRSVVQGRLVRRCAQGSARLAYFRWAGSSEDDPSSPRVWARLNPAVGRRMTIERIASEYDAMSPSKFGHERLGIGDYPRAEGEDWVIPQRRWESAGDPESAMMTGQIVFSVEVKWDRTAASISVAGKRADGQRHIETIANEVGTQWAVRDLAQLTKKHQNLGVVLDPNSPTNTLVGPLRDAGVEVHLLKADDKTQAFGNLYDGLMSEEPTYHHRGGTVLTSSLAEAQTKRSGGSMTWNIATTADVTPIVSATWAAHGLDMLSEPAPPATSPRAVRTRRPDVSGPTADVATMSF